MWNVTPIFATPVLNTFIDPSICKDLKGLYPNEME